MKTIIIKWLKKLFSLSTLKRRIVFFLTVGVTTCCLLMAIVSYKAIYNMQQNNIKMAMLFDLNQQSTSLTQTYTNLLLITQQMTPQGNIGSLVDEFYSSKDKYQRSVLTRSISSNIGLIAFSHENIQLIMYYSPDDGQVYFNNLPPRDGVPLKSLPELASYLDIVYQPPHTTLNRFSGDQVVSVTREITFSNGKHWIIYVEAKSDISSDINLLSKTTNMPYILTMLDAQDKVRYSSNPKDFPVGQKMILSNQSDIDNNYKWNRTDSDYGYSIAMLVSTKSYNHELYSWKNYMFVILGVDLLILAFITVMVLQLIYKPLHIFEVEMNSFRNGNLGVLQYSTGIDEFDRLFDQFNDMKQHIQQLIIDNKQKEKQRHQLEIDKLMYQINPHFLMNALNSVHWMAVVNKQDKIDKFICTLNYLLSYNLGKLNESATLRTEIKVLQAYFELQQMRYDFEVKMNIEEGNYLDYPVARFILQPIVENSISHGIDEHGKIEIGISQDTNLGMINIRIHDDGIGLSADTLEMLQHPEDMDNKKMGRGIGIRYVHSILESFYGDSARMLIESAPKQGTTVLLYLPFKQEGIG